MKAPTLLLQKHQQRNSAALSPTRGHVPADVEQTAAPVSPRLRDGGDGRGGAAETGLREQGLRRCTDTLRRHVFLADCSEGAHFLFWSVDG